MAVINMSKTNGNTKINMVKDDGSAMKIAFIGISWNKNRYAGEANFDLDLCGFLTDGSRKVQYPIEIGRLYRYNGGFKFQAIGSGYQGGMTELFKNFGLDIDEGRD